MPIFSENKGHVNAFGVMFWFCWMWLVAVVGRCLAGCEHCSLTVNSTCFGHHYANLQENIGPVTAFVVLFWFCWMWLVAVVGRCVVGCEHCSLTVNSTCFGHHYAHLQEIKGPVNAFGVLFWFCWMWLVAVVGRCDVGCEQ